MPEQFGLIAMLAIFMQVAQSLIDSGFGSALIQRKDATYLDECSVFYFNILIGFVVAGLLYISAPWIAAFYKAPLLKPLARVFSLNLVINSFGVVQIALLTKRIDFKVQTRVSVVAGIISGVIGIAMAYYGFGVWSLVWHYISLTFFRTVLFWVFCSWRPSWKFSFASLRSMFSFGSKLLLSGLMETIFNNIFFIVIGKMFSLKQLGYYLQADRIASFPARNLCFPITRAAFPLFSSLQDDKIRLKQETKKVLSVSALINFPLMIGLAAVAKPLVFVLLTEKWLPSVPYIQLICIAWILYPCQMINSQILLALGRSDLFFRIEIFKKVLIILILIITVPAGVLAILYGGIITSLIFYYINSYYVGKLLLYSMTEQIKDLVLIFLSSVLMGIVVFMLGVIPVGNMLLLLLQVPVGVIIYISVCYLFKLESFNTMMLYVIDEYKKIRRQKVTVC